MKLISYPKQRLKHYIHKKLCPVPWTERGMFLVDLCMKYRISIENVAEIGVWKGHTSFALLHLLPSIRKYHLVDPWENYSDYEKSCDAKANNALQSAATVCAERLEAFRDKLVWHNKFSHEAARDIADNSLDLVFIDGNHDYDYVRQDIESWQPKVRSGGILAGHDLDWKDAPGVRKAIESFFGHDWNAGPDMVWWRIEK